MNYYSYIDKPVSVQTVLDPQLVWVKVPRDLYNDDIADDEWKLCESAEGDGKREIIRPSANESPLVICSKILSLQL